MVVQRKYSHFLTLTDGQAISFRVYVFVRMPLNTFGKRAASSNNPESSSSSPQVVSGDPSTKNAGIRKTHSSQHETRHKKSTTYQNMPKKDPSYNMTEKRKSLRARETITSHFRIPSSRHLEPIFTRTILNVGFATPAAWLLQIDSIWPKSGREF
jgi:hypothetical protein